MRVCAALLALAIAGCGAPIATPAPSPSPEPSPTMSADQWAIEWGGAPAIYAELLALGDCRQLQQQINHYRALHDASGARYLQGYVEAANARAIALGCYR